MTLQEILSHFPGADKDRDNHWMAFCPAHETNGSHRPSLSITLNGSKVLVKCFAGCKQEAIAEAAGMKLADLFTDEPKKKTHGKQPIRLVAMYDYRDAEGRLIYQVVRYEPKDFRQRRPDPDHPGNWVWNMDGVDRVLYRLPEVLAARDAGRPVWVVEGEKDADLLSRLGLCATTSPGGAGKWKDDYARCLDDAHVVIVPDRDAVGLEHARQVFASVEVGAASVKWLQLPGGKDASDWAAVTGLEKEDELRAHFESLAASAPAAPPTDAAPPAEPPPAPAIEVREAPADEFQLTDLGNARRLVARHGHTLAYCRIHARWYAWNGVRWSAEDGYDLVMQRAKETSDDLLAQAAEATDRARKKELAVHALRIQAASRLQAMVSLAETEPGIPRKPDEWDRDPFLLNAANGTLDLKSGELLPHDPRRLITRLAPTAYDPQAQCPKWLKYLERIMPDAEERAFLQRAVGYTLTADVGERCVFFLWGDGSNGKSTFLDVLSRLLGDYAKRIPVDTILDRRGEAIPNDLAMLAGLRLAFTSEAKQQKRLDESRIKDLSSGAEPITARFLRAEYFEFRPQFKLFLSTNHKPVIKGTDNAIWSRIRLIPFTEKIGDEEKIPGLSAILAAEEGPGILAWAVRGCLDWQKHGLGLPEAIRQAVGEYRRESDILRDFIEDSCIIHREVSDSAKNLYRSYESWAKENGEDPASQRHFGLQLGERGFKKVRTKTGIEWYGIKVATMAEKVTFLSEKDEPRFTVNHSEPESRLILDEKISRRENQNIGSLRFTELQGSPDNEIVTSATVITPHTNLFETAYNSHLDECKKCKVDAQGADLCDEGKRIFGQYLKSIGKSTDEEESHG